MGVMIARTTAATSKPIAIPPYTSIFFARDGSISVVAQGQAPDTTSTVGRIKLVNPPEADLERGDDGLFRLKNSGEAEPDAAVQIGSGMLESSNVNTADAPAQPGHPQHHARQHGGGNTD